MSTPEPPDHTSADDGLSDEFPREAELLRSLASEPLDLVDAPPGLWDQIEAAAGREASHPEPSAPSIVSPIPLVPQPSDPVPPVPPTATPRRRASRSRRVALVACAAVVVVALVVGVGLLVTDQASGPQTVASAELVAFGDAAVGDATATVDLIDQDGRQRLRVDMHDLPTLEPGTFYELWLIDPSTGRPVSVTVMDEGSSDVTAEVDVPAGTDPTRYEVVDVSVQDASAGPAHSGNSVLRGTLTT